MQQAPEGQSSDAVAQAVAALVQKYGRLSLQKVR